MTVSKEEIDRRLSEKLKEYELQHTAWVYLRHGNTYVGFDTMDYITENLMSRLHMLLDLMRIPFSIHHPFGEDAGYYVMIKGEFERRAAYIQKFIDNGYKLVW